MNDSLTALITNDDGIDSPGLHQLAAAAVAAGLNVIIAAPAEQASGSSAAITAAEDDGHIMVRPRQIESLSEVPAFAVEAAPALIALMGTQKAFGPASDLVLSGINHGANVGRAILHSGTVGAALTGSINGTRAMAVSLDVPLGSEPQNWDTAATLAARLIPLLLNQPEGTTLNLNVPDHSHQQLPEYRVASLAPFGAVQTTVTQDDQQSFRRSVIEVDTADEPNSDARLLSAGFATVTALNSLSEDGSSAVYRDIRSGVEGLSV